MPAAITANRLSKSYRLGPREPYGALRDAIARVLTAPFRRVDPQTGPDRIWALDDVSFDIEQGDVVGIIGRNGSGKSTLLKILSRITDPTSGEAVVRGRVGSLLEVGTGFHPELSGRENVFVNGAMLGMSRRHIVQRFNAIVAFAGVERFIDTPVKHYSSGMQMRLAFAVAAHLEPHILLVDEVLAVGDAEFQRRCLGKMRDVSRDGRTVLLVSHQMGQIRRLCSRVLWLDRGRVRAFGAPGVTIHAYESAILSGADAGARGQCFTGWTLGDGRHLLTDGTRPFTMRLRLALPHAIANGHFGLGLLGPDDDVIAGWAFEPVTLPRHADGLEVTIPQLPLRPGVYRWSFALFDGGNNLTGGKLIEKWTGVPELGLDVRPVGHTQDAWAGVLNLPATLRVPATGARLESAASAPDLDMDDLPIETSELM
ncbi:MAG: polysaccharide ABC transporter ATP-binding protein [Acidobacteriota bacterium]